MEYLGVNGCEAGTAWAAAAWPWLPLVAVSSCLSVSCPGRAVSCPMS